MTKYAIKPPIRTRPVRPPTTPPTVVQRASALEADDEDAGSDVGVVELEVEVEEGAK